MEPTFSTDAERVKLIKKAKDLFDNGDHTKALEIIEDMILVHREDRNAWCLHMEQGRMFKKLAERTENPDLDFAYVLGSVGCFSEDVNLSRPCAHGLYYLAQKLGSVLYYKKFVDKAKQCLYVSSATHPNDSDSVAQMSLWHNTLMNGANENMESLIKDAEFKIAASKTGGLNKGPENLLQDCEPEILESKKSTEPLKDEFKRLRSYWVGLDIKMKRDFMKVSIAKFISSVHCREGRDALEQVLASARKDRKWTFWMCRTICSKTFSSAEECKNHLEQQHAAAFKLSSEKDMVKRIGKEWVRKISVGGWEPVERVAAVEMIKNQLADVKAFASKSKNG